MAHNDIEIEIQAQVESDAPLCEFLRREGVFVSERRQVDEYFSPAHRDFVAVRPVAEWLRLRDADGACSINYKNWHHDAAGRGRYCDEYESPVGDIGRMRKILAALDFRPVVTVEKVRKIWTHGDYEIAIDEVRGLGSFVEIEYIGRTAADPEETMARMIRFLKERGCGKITRNHVGYPFQLLFGDEVRYEAA